MSEPFFLKRGLIELPNESAKNIDTDQPAHGLFGLIPGDFLSRTDDRQCDQYLCQMHGPMNSPKLDTCSQESNL